ncbi:MAG: hypothetical protein ACTH31_03370 [Pseudoclavibacter sp.]
MTVPMSPAGLIASGFAGAPEAAAAMAPSNQTTPEPNQDNT